MNDHFHSSNTQENIHTVHTTIRDKLQNGKTEIESQNEYIFDLIYMKRCRTYENI